MSIYDNADIKVFRVGMYLRVSKEDENTGQSESIENQKKILNDYVLAQEWSLFDTYIDDGFSGLNFERPGFKRLIEDIKMKKINLVITKDLSRLGRDYIDTGYYIEKFFPTSVVRYIALADGIDTFVQNSCNVLSPFIAVINDMYARDTSKKIRIIMDSKRKNGEFIGAFAPYGYIKDTGCKGKLIIDKNVAYIVQEIFDLYVNGLSMVSISNSLNEKSVLSLIRYKQKNSKYQNNNSKTGLWAQPTIKKILTNQTYCGDMVQKRQEKVSYKSKIVKNVPCTEWIIVENTHEAIITREQFIFVKELINKKAIRFTKKEGVVHIFNGIVFCKECKSKFTYRKSNGKSVMNCSHYWKDGSLSCCSHLINEEVFDLAIKEELRKISSQVITSEFFDNFKTIEIKKEIQNLRLELIKINNRMSEIKIIIKAMYEDKVKGILTEENFSELARKYSEESDLLREQYISLKQNIKMQTESIPPNYIQILKEAVSFETLDIAIINKLINRIEIDKDKRINIYYNFSDPYQL